MYLTKKQPFVNELSPKGPDTVLQLIQNILKLMSGKLTGFWGTVKKWQQQETLGARVSDDHQKKKKKDSIYCSIAGLLSREVSSDF